MSAVPVQPAIPEEKPPEEHPIEGWKAIGDLLGLTGSLRSIQRRLRGWEREEGLPVFRRRGRIFGWRAKVLAWHREGPRGTSTDHK
jgi:hypothetical protein